MKAKDLKLILAAVADDTPVNISFMDQYEAGKTRQLDDQNVFAYEENGVLQLTNKEYGAA